MLAHRPLNSPWANPCGWAGAAATHPERRSGRSCPRAPPKKCSACTADWVPRRTNWGSGGGSGEAAIVGRGAVIWGPRKGVSDPPVAFRKAVGASLDAAHPLPPVFHRAYWPLPPHGITVAPACTTSGRARGRPHPSEVTLTLSALRRAHHWPPGLVVHPPSVSSDSLNPTGHSSRRSDSSSLGLASSHLGCPHALGCLSCLWTWLSTANSVSLLPHEAHLLSSLQWSKDMPGRAVYSGPVASPGNRGHPGLLPPDQSPGHWHQAHSSCSASAY